MQSIALIGTGMVARTHLLSIADLKDRIRLKGVLARTADSAEAFAKNASVTCGYPVAACESLEALCDDEPDWVIVLTPPNARADIVQALTEKGIAILMEKPVERTLQAATEIVAMCETANIKLGIVFQHRMRPVTIQLQNMIGRGDLGDIVLVQAEIPWWREQAYYDEPGRGTYGRDGGGVLISQAIHTLDLMMQLAGRVTDLQAMASTTRLHRMESEDHVTAGLTFENGAIGSLVASTACFPGAAESLTLHGTKGVARLCGGEIRIDWRDGTSDVAGEAAGTGGGADPMAFTHDWHCRVISDFAEAFAAGKPPAITGRSALDVHALIDALDRSARTRMAQKVHFPEGPSS